MEHFDYQRNDGYQTKIDAGFEDLNLQKDAAKIMLYMKMILLVLIMVKNTRLLKENFSRVSLLC